MLNKNQKSKATSLYINNNIPRDGNLHSAANGIKKWGTLDLTKQKSIALLGFSARSACYRYLEKLKTVGMVSITYTNSIPTSVSFLPAAVA